MRSEQGAGKERASGEPAIWLNDRDLYVDHAHLATGYRVDIGVPTGLARGKLLTGLFVREGLPQLDAYLQSNLPELYFTGLWDAKDFGPS